MLNSGKEKGYKPVVSQAMQLEGESEHSVHSELHVTQVEEPSKYVLEGQTSTQVLLEVSKRGVGPVELQA